jgi:hypothetical protein
VNYVLQYWLMVRCVSVAFAAVAGLWFLMLYYHSTLAVQHALQDCNDRACWFIKTCTQSDTDVIMVSWKLEPWTWCRTLCSPPVHVAPGAGR